MADASNPTLLGLVERNATEHAGLPAIVDGEQRLTWARYRRRARAIALALIDLGVRPGQVVGLHMVDRAEHMLSDVAALLAGAIPTSYYNTARGIEVASPAEAVASPEVRKEAARAVAAGNEWLARVEQIKRWELLDHLWDGESGELTPTMKLKRSVVAERYREHIDRLYAEQGAEGGARA
jgi:long-subunit acyl-CoA synthetase (AMP-forming)